MAMKPPAAKPQCGYQNMKQNLQIKPSKQTGVVQMVGGIVFALIGMAFVIPMTYRANGPVWFGVLWTGGAVVIAILGAINAFSNKGIPTEEIVFDSADARSAKSTEDRLRELEGLYQRKLICLKPNQPSQLYGVFAFQ